jgi:hypothetical protein
MTNTPNDFNLHQLIQPNIPPLLLKDIIHYDFTKFKEKITSLYLVIKTTSSIHQPIEIEESNSTFSIIISTVPNQNHFLQELQDFVSSQKKILLLKLDEFDSIQDQHLKFLILINIQFNHHAIFIYFRYQRPELTSILIWPIFFIQEFGFPLKDKTV